MLDLGVESARRAGGDLQCVAGGSLQHGGDGLHRLGEVGGHRHLGFGRMGASGGRACERDQNQAKRQAARLRIVHVRLRVYRVKAICPFRYSILE